MASNDGGAVCEKWVRQFCWGWGTEEGRNRQKARVLYLMADEAITRCSLRLAILLKRYDEVKGEAVDRRLVWDTSVFWWWFTADFGGELEAQSSGAIPEWAIMQNCTGRIRQPSWCRRQVVHKWSQELSKQAIEMWLCDLRIDSVRYIVEKMKALLCEGMEKLTTVGQPPIICGAFSFLICMPAIEKSKVIGKSCIVVEAEVWEERREKKAHSNAVNIF